MEKEFVPRKQFSRDSIIGLGEDSFKKNYYPELQEKILNLEKINARNRAIIATIPDTLLVFDKQGVLSPFSDVLKSDDAVQKAVFHSNELLEKIVDTASQVYKNQSFYIKEYHMEIEGEKTYLEARFHISETGEVLIMIRNMTERILMQNRLLEKVERDDLTGLYNRRCFENELGKCDGKVLERMAVVSIDINGLKFVNDTLGHLVGDRMLAESAKIILEVLGSRGQVYRIGGDEFAGILKDLEEAQVDRLLEQLQVATDAYNRRSDHGTLSLAYGYAYHSYGPVNMEYMFQIADNNMYQNKLLKQESTRSTFVKTFMKALEAKDYVSEGHVSRMEELAACIGEAVNLHQDQLDRLLLLTKFHDIGKIGIPDSILKKPARLTEDEWKVMRTHSAIGERIARESSEIKEIAPLILHHHEKWDGSGYPGNLQGSEIPIEDRILNIVDSYDAMTNDRPYHKAMSEEEATWEIHRCSGTQYDPEIVRVFCEIQKGKGISCIKQV